MKRSDALSAMRLAGYHDDSRAFTRLVCTTRVSREKANEQWRIGRQLRAAGVRCECFTCREAKAVAS